MRQHGLARVLAGLGRAPPATGSSTVLREQQRALYLHHHRYDHATPQSEDANSLHGAGRRPRLQRQHPPTAARWGQGVPSWSSSRWSCPSLTSSQPELVLVSAGFDAAAGDPLRLPPVPAMYGHHDGGAGGPGQRPPGAGPGGRLLPAGHSGVQPAVCQGPAGRPLPPLHLEPQMKPGAVETVRRRGPGPGALLELPGPVQPGAARGPGSRLLPGSQERGAAR